MFSVRQKTHLINFIDSKSEGKKVTKDENDLDNPHLRLCTGAFVPRELSVGTKECLQRCLEQAENHEDAEHLETISSHVHSNRTYRQRLRRSNRQFPGFFNLQDSGFFRS